MFTVFYHNYGAMHLSNFYLKPWGRMKPASPWGGLYYGAKTSSTAGLGILHLHKNELKVIRRRFALPRVAIALDRV